jgi:Predicted RNA-binding proteins
VLTPTQLNELVRELGNTRVLTVYHGARVTDPAMRHSWRAALGAALQPVRNGITDEDERAEFDRAAAYLDDPWPPIEGVWGMKGWAAFLTPDGARYAGSLPVQPPTLAAWRYAPVITPYLRAFKQHRPVIIALVDSRSARIYRYALGELQELPDMALSVPEAAEPGAPERPQPKGGPSHPGPRGSLDTESLQRRKEKNFNRLATSLTSRLVDLAGDDGWILIGGTREWARHAGDAIPSTHAGRAMVSSTLDHNAHEKEIAEAAKHAASELRSAQGHDLVERILERSCDGGRGASGVPTVQRALQAGAVDLLVVSPHFLNRADIDVEELVRAALARGADIEVLSGSAATELDERSEGVAARLRFPINERAAASASPEDARMSEVTS